MFHQGFLGEEKGLSLMGIISHKGLCLFVQISVKHLIQVNTKKAWEGSLCSRQETSMSLWLVFALQSDPLVSLIRFDTCRCGRCD